MRTCLCCGLTKVSWAPQESLLYGTTTNVKSPGFLGNVLKAFPLFGRTISAGQLVFVCNICGTRTSADLTDILDRELPTCSNCRSSIRFRSLVAALEERLFNQVSPLSQLQERKDINGLGMSDEKVYSLLLEQKFSYTNTFFHTEPRLDITDPPSVFRNRFDFVISAEVMEHVPPPIGIAFRNLRSLLRPSGLLVLSVPFSQEPDTVEHFPELHRFEIRERSKEPYLVNITREGDRQIFRNLIFHGGRGMTLEMRLFSRSAVLKLLEESGFGDIRIHSKLMPEWGIVHLQPFSLPITAI